MLTRDAFQSLYDQGPDAVFALISALQRQIVILQEQNATPSARTKVLEDRQNTDSHNSSKLPASDALAKKPVSLRSSTGRKAGGQRGHHGRTLLVSDRPRPDHPSRSCAVRRLRERACRYRSRPHRLSPGRRCAPACTRHHPTSGADQSLCRQCGKPPPLATGKRGKAEPCAQSAGSSVRV